jgi:exopolyphosphatase/guanosine-5'-triphosphate,3'-diphosphate pyrophosphatase
VTRLAAVDLGTNATRLLVADVVDGEVVDVVRRSRITRLGEGVDARRLLLPVPIARVRNALSDYRRELEELGAQRTLAVATSAVRDASNGEAFLGEIEWSYGFQTSLLSGDDEAALTLRGVGPLAPGVLVVDVGGGSTELIAPGFRRSLDVGSVRLTERFGTDIEAAAAYVRDLLPALDADRAVGVDGTTAELAAIVGDRTVTRARLVEVTRRLAAASSDERRELLVLEPERADVIVAGLTILREVLDRYEIELLTASDRDLLTGAVLLLADSPQAPEADAPPGAFTCC